MSTVGATSLDLAKDRATALTDELFARGFDSLFLADLDLVGGEQLATVDARAGLLTGAPARGQGATSPGLANDSATALSDELLADMVRKPQRPPGETFRNRLDASPAEHSRLPESAAAGDNLFHRSGADSP